MQVLHVIPSVAPRYGGPSQAVVGMGRALGTVGIPVLIATTDADGPTTLDVPLGVAHEWQGVQTLFFHREFTEALKFSRPLAVWLSQRVRDFAVVHIHAVFSHACLSAARACRAHGVPYVVRPLGTLDPWSLRQKPLRKRVLWELGAKQMLANAAAIHYTTRTEQRLAEASLGLRRGVVIPLGIDYDAYTSAADVSGFRARYAQLGDCPYVLVLGRLHPKKRIERLLAAFSSTGDAWRLVIAGDGDPDYVAHLRQLAETDGRIIFTGWLRGQAKIAALQGASLLALISHQENFGVVVVESLACGVPVLISREVNLADDVEAGVAGWVVDAESPGLESTLAAALNDRDERHRRGAAAQKLAARFRWTAIADDLKSLYASVAAA